MGYDALTPGDVELALGVHYLLEKSKRAKITFLLANLLEKRSNKPVFQPYLIRELGGIKIGLVGLISNRFPLEGPSEEKGKFYLNDPIKTAQRIVATLKRKKCQAIIVLAHMEEEEQKKLAQASPEVQFIISGHSRNYLFDPIRVKNTQILGSGVRGEYLGQLNLAMEQNKLQGEYKIFSLGENYADHKQMEKLLSQYKAKHQNRFTTSRSGGGQGQGKPLAFAIPSYLGEAVCRSCHLPQYENWKKTRHARAFQTLVENKKSSDFSCLPCHTTGLQEMNDPGNLLENVQCESCHGPGKGHPEAKGIFSKVSEARCLSCHNPAKSLNYNHESYLSKVQCPK